MRGVSATDATPQPERHDHHERQHSPVRLQYFGVKRQYPDALLFFRMGDFYELFDADAEVAARELELTLTRRDWGRGEKSPMAGVPHHAADGYIARLIAKGYRVAVCEQTSDPALSKGLVEREVLRVVTPGTVVDPAMLAAKRNNYLAAAVLGRDAVGIAYADITTGEFCCAQLPAADPEATLAQELARVYPAELLLEAVATEQDSFAPWRREASSQRGTEPTPPATFPTGEGGASDAPFGLGSPSPVGVSSSPPPLPPAVGRGASDAP
ncbi:MAG TPA: hypothetical protein VGR88_01760, partial [Ktedonobacterales bacterium]|nr:hypothetical protein [Ktedonobacterales bacterium]